MANGQSDEETCVCVGLDPDEWESLLNVVKAASQREFQDRHEETAEAVRQLGAKILEQVRDKDAGSE